MNISSETITDMYCEPQFSRMRVMIPTVQRQHGILLIRTAGQQQNDVEFTSAAQGYIPRNINNNQQANCVNLHGNANTNVKILNKIAAGTNNNDDDDDKNDNPIDLSSTSTISSFTVVTPNQDNEDSVLLQETNNETTTKNNTEDNEIKKRLSCKIGKRKNSTLNNNNNSESEDLILIDNKRNIDSWVGHVKPVPGIPRQAGNKREEVLKAARSLFSKRTRTLYHWLCPTTSKTKLKSTVAAAWDTLSSAEKDFYISQVLGRFGVPACSLMVNPQLGGLKTDEKLDNFNNMNNNTIAGTSSNMEETRRAVSNLLLNENDTTWSPYNISSHHQLPNEELPRKKRKNHQTYKPAAAPEMSNIKEDHHKHPEQEQEEETLMLKEIRDANMEEDFADDPELNTEFEQFRNLIDIELARFDFNDVLDGI